jgi:hypothetical protein
MTFPAGERDSKEESSFSVEKEAKRLSSVCAVPER